MLGLLVALTMSDRRKNITEQDFRYTRTGALIVWAVIIITLLCWATSNTFNGYIGWAGAAITGVIYMLDNIQANKKFLKYLRR